MTSSDFLKRNPTFQPDVGIEPTASTLGGLRSANWARRAEKQEKNSSNLTWRSFTKDPIPGIEPEATGWKPDMLPTTPYRIWGKRDPGGIRTPDCRFRVYRANQLHYQVQSIMKKNCLENQEEGGVRTPEPEGPRPERGAFDHFATSPNNWSSPGFDPGEDCSWKEKEMFHHKKKEWKEVSKEYLTGIHGLLNSWI